MFYVSAKYEKLSDVFSASICSWDVVETLRSKDSIKLYAAKLRKNVKSLISFLMQAIGTRCKS